MKCLVIVRLFRLNQGCCSSFIAANRKQKVSMKKLSLLLSCLFFLLATCSPRETATQPTEPQTLTIMTHDSFAVSEDVVKAFEEANNAKVVFLQSGDAGAVLNRAVLTKDAPLADLLFGVD